MAEAKTAPGSGGSVQQRASRKYGPLALWQWMILILLGLFVFEYVKSKRSPSSTGSTSSTGAGDTSQTSVPNNSTAFVFDAANYNFNTNQSPSNGNTGTEPPGHPILNGGHPPVGVAGPVPVSKPTAPTGTAKKTVTVGEWPAWNGSLFGIAQREYGNGNLWPKIYSANKSVIGSNPNSIKKGMVLVIP